MPFALLCAFSTGLSLARAEEPTFYEVAGAPKGCSSAYVFPRSAPMMAEAYGQPWTLEPAKLEGVDWGACSRMIPHDGSAPVWVVTIWESGFRGNMFCSAEGRISKVLVVGDETTPGNPEVKSRWYDATGLTPGVLPSGAPPCPAGTPPEPDPAAVEALHPPDPEPEAPHVAKTHRLSIAGELEAGTSSALGGFVIGGRLGVGSVSRHFWVGGALQVNTWQAVPQVNRWFYQATAIDPAFWGVWKVDRKGQLRLHGLVGGGPVRYQRSWDDENEHQVDWTAGFMGSAQVSYRIISLGASVYGPGARLCESDECDIGLDRQLTLGVFVVR